MGPGPASPPAEAPELGPTLPVEKPRIVVAVMIDEPSAGKYFGGDVAAPVFSATVQQSLRMLGVQPDMNVKPQVVVQAVEESF